MLGMSRGVDVPYTISPAPGGNYIMVEIEGEITRDLAYKHVVDAHAAGDKLGIRCFLFDVTKARNVESVLGNFKMTHEDTRLLPAKARRACIAVLVDPHDDSHDFNETLAQNAGLDVTMFRERDKAIAHLEEGAERFRAHEDG